MNKLKLPFSETGPYEVMHYPDGCALFAILPPVVENGTCKKVKLSEGDVYNQVFTDRDGFCHPWFIYAMSRCNPETKEATDHDLLWFDVDGKAQVLRGVLEYKRLGSSGMLARRDNGWYLWTFTPFSSPEEMLANYEGVNPPGVEYLGDMITTVSNADVSIFKNRCDDLSIVTFVCRDRRDTIECKSIKSFRGYAGDQYKNGSVSLSCDGVFPDVLEIETIEGTTAYVSVFVDYSSAENFTISTSDVPSGILAMAECVTGVSVRAQHLGLKQENLPKLSTLRYGVDKELSYKLAFTPFGPRQDGVTESRKVVFICTSAGSIGGYEIHSSNGESIRMSDIHIKYVDDNCFVNGYDLQGKYVEFNWSKW